MGYESEDSFMVIERTTLIGQSLNKMRISLDELDLISKFIKEITKDDDSSS